MLSLVFESCRNQVLPATRAISARSADFSGRIEQIDGNGQVRKTLGHRDKERDS